MLESLAPILTLVGIWFAYRVNRHKKLSQRLQSYEAILSDVYFLLMFPWKEKERKAEAIEFNHDDPELRDAVRAYLKAGPSATLSPPAEYVPSRITDEDEQLRYKMTIMDQVNAHRNLVSEAEYNITAPELSPVHYLDIPEVEQRLNNVLSHVGKNLSSFGPRTRDLWTETATNEPGDVRRRYRECIEFCPNYFEHNPREFSDPYLDLLFAIRDEHRLLTKTPPDAITHQLRSVVRKLRHPVLKFRAWRYDRH